MADQKLQLTGQTVAAFMQEIPEPRRQEEAKILLEMFKRLSGKKPAVWSHGMIGFGKLHYKYASGHEGDCFEFGFAPRKGKHSLYLCGISFSDPLFQQLGKHTHGTSCLYINKLADVDLHVLEQIIKKGLNAKNNLVCEKENLAP